MSNSGPVYPKIIEATSPDQPLFVLPKSRKIDKAPSGGCSCRRCDCCDDDDEPVRFYREPVYYQEPEPVYYREEPEPGLLRSLFTVIGVGLLARRLLR
jgi:hypothetical protein